MVGISIRVKHKKTDFHYVRVATIYSLLRNGLKLSLGNDSMQGYNGGKSKFLGAIMWQN